MKAKRVSIIGFGRFGQVLATILKDNFVVQVTDADAARADMAKELGLDFVATKEAMDADALFYCVPISQLEVVLTDI